MPRRRYWRQWLIVAVALLSVVGITGAAIAATTSYPVTVTMTSSDGTVLGTTTVNVPIPTVTVTATATVTATPTTAATATPTATPTTGTPTPSASATGLPVQSGAVTLIGVHDKVYDNVTFDGSGNGNPDSSAVLTVAGGCYNLTFRNCTIRPNRDGVGNGIRVFDFYGAAPHDIRFEDCTIETQPRMGFECNGRVAGRGYARIDLIDCTFEVQGSEAVSYDDDTGLGGDCTISGNLIKGGGAGTLYPWDQGLEINGVRDMTVTGNTIWACGGCGLNFGGPSGDCGWTFTDNVVDFTQGTITPSVEGNPVYCRGVTGGTFADNRIVNKNAWSIAYLSDCHGMDWRGTVWSGANSTPYQTNCSGLMF